MIVNDRITDYINSLERSGPLLTEIASKARKERVPVIREETASFLISLVESKRPAAIRGWHRSGLFNASDGGRHAGELPYYND